MHRCSRFGLGLAVDMLPISTCRSDQAPDVYEVKDAPAGHPGAAGAPPPPAAGAECARLMTDLVVELIDTKAI